MDFRKVIMPAIGVLLLLGALLSISRGIPNSHTEGTRTPLPQARAVEIPSPSDARAMCQQFVSGRLIAPSSARFLDSTAEQRGNAYSWNVQGEVDAQNAFGVPIRQSYNCDLSYQGDSKWRALAVQVAPRR